MFSVVIPLYNKQELIKKTLDSLLAQTFEDFEVVVVNDGSSDNSVAVIEENFSDTRIRIINQQNTGVATARNRGIKEAKGEYIAFLDADDEWKSDYLATQYSLIQKYPDTSVFATNYEFKDHKGEITPTIINNLHLKGEDGIIDNYFEIASTSHPPLWTSAVVAKKSALEDINGFPIGIKSGEDILTWAKLVINGKPAYSKKVMSVYNLGEGYDYSNLPPRRQDEGDPVGKEFKKLYKENPTVPGLRNYLSLWHKMRASVAIRYNDRWETIKESFYALKYNPANFKILPFLVMSLLPYSVNKRFFSLKRHV